MQVQEFLQRCADNRPTKVALICGGQRYTYAQLEDTANRLANALREKGVRRGDRVAIYLNNSLEAVVSVFAVLKADAVFVMINRNTKPDKLVSILNNCQSAAVITDYRAIGQGIGDRIWGDVGSVRCSIVCGEKLARRAEDSRWIEFERIEADFPAERPRQENIDLDLACLIYTSGTTGESKGVMCGHSNVAFVTNSIVTYLKNVESDVILNVLPLSFSYGLYQLMAVFHVGATLVLEESFAYPAMVLQKMSDERVTGFAGVPTIYSTLLGMDLGQWDLSALRYLTNAAAALPVNHVKRLKQKFPAAALYLMHGLTEVARTMYLPPEQLDARPASAGIPMPGTELWIEDEGGRRVGPGVIGELVVRGRHVMRGYWMAPELSSQRFRPGPLPGEQVCYSGDLFRTDEEGFFYFVSRKDDIIKSSGEKVAPREVENVLYAIKGVQEAAVIGVPDAAIGQAIKAFIVAPGAGPTSAVVIAHCKAHLEEFMVPRFVEFRDELPKTGSGKIRKVDLR